MPLIIKDGSGNYINVSPNMPLPSQVVYGKTLTRIPVAQGAAGTTQLLAASPGNKHKVVGGLLTMGAAGSLKFIDGVGDLTGPLDLGANSGFIIVNNPAFPLIETAVNSALSIVTTAGKANGVVIVVTEP